MIYFLTTRSVQFAVTMALDVMIIYFIFRSRIVDRMNIWPPVSGEKRKE